VDRPHLEYFLAVAEQGSFTRAAAALSIAQPSLSHAIALLERDLGSQGRLSPLAQRFVDVAAGGPTDGGGP
jgi:Bacterial regulatory helix-turn-helix protein, lysR family